MFDLAQLRIYTARRVTILTSVSGVDYGKRLLAGKTGFVVYADL